MPFDLTLTTAASAAGLGRRAARPLDLSILQLPPGTPPLRKRPDGAAWVRRIDTGEPWFAAFVRGGHVVLSTSVTNHRYLTNVADLLAYAARVADSTGLHAFDPDANAVTGAGVGPLVAPGSGFLAARQHELTAAVEQLRTQPGGPLEWPIGGVDLVAEYCVFRLVSTRAAFTDLSQVLGPGDLDTRIVATGARSAAVMRDGLRGEMALARAVLRRDGLLRIWPAHGATPFSISAGAAYDLALGVRARTNATLTLQGHVIDGAVTAEVERAVEGLGVDFYELALRMRQASAAAADPD